MTGTISSFGFGGISSQLLLGVQNLSQAKDSLQLQATTGVMASSYADLGSSRTQALALQPAITQVAAWNSNVTNAQTTLTTTQSSLSQISTIAQDLTSSLSTLGSTLSYSTVTTAASAAQSALASLGNLLNTRQGDSYVFAGQQNTTAPVSTDLGTSDLATQIAQAVSQLGSDGAQSVLDTTENLASNTAAGQPFSATLSTSPDQAQQQNTRVVVGQSETVSVGMVATQGATSTSTTSPIRDLMRNLMVVASLGSSSTSTTDYASLISGLQSSMNTVTSGLGTMSGLLGVQQNSLTNQTAMLTQMSSALTTQLGQVKDADLAQVSTQVTDTNNQLQASYSLIADMKGMTLASYL
ncbi:flagellin [Gluconobacter albidus]|uniref:flagellin n=1 Tax=Gluconobacter albidus TaxID=318683 RepID=UPI0030AE387F